MIKSLEKHPEIAPGEYTGEWMGIHRLKKYIKYIRRIFFPYKEWIKLREESKDEFGDKLCYCGHTYKCDCAHPTKKMFKDHVKIGNISLWDKNNGWKKCKHL
jgi:hypothetical protein